MSHPIVRRNLRSILDKIQTVWTTSTESSRAPTLPRLVAVSKTKPYEMIIALYEEGHRTFGENYVQELVEKANDPVLREKCPEIRWHFIGNLQSNKVCKVVQIPNLSVVETVTSLKLVDKLNSLWHVDDGRPPLQVMIQVNTSGEENKNGVEPSEVVDLARHIRDNCKSIQLIGLMTIGDLGHSLAIDRKEGEPNPDFLLLIQCRKDVANALGVEEHSLELSMGMSNDFEEAIQMGSTNVRVGSSIFGERVYKSDSPIPPTYVEQVAQNLSNVELK